MTPVNRGPSLAFYFGFPGIFFLTGLWGQGKTHIEWVKTMNNIQVNQWIISEASDKGLSTL